MSWLLVVSNIVVDNPPASCEHDILHIVVWSSSIMSIRQGNFELFSSNLGEHNGRYKVFCDASESFPHGLEIELEGDNIFQVGEDGSVRCTAPKRFEDEMLVTQAEMNATGSGPLPFLNAAKDQRITEIMEGTSDQVDENKKSLEVLV